MRPIIHLLLCWAVLCACQSDSATDASTTLLTEDSNAVMPKLPTPANGAEGFVTSTTSNGTNAAPVAALNAARRSEVRSLPGIDIDINQRITGPRGETILIPANSLVDAQGNTVRGKVQVNWTAALTLDELFAMKAPTVADGTLLGSGGSIYLAAEQEGRPLRIKEGMDWKVSIPSEPVTLFPKQTMKVFTGERKRDEVTWSLAPGERIETIPISYKYFLLDQADMIGAAHFARIDSLAHTYPARENNSVVAPRPELAIGRDKAAIAQLVLPLYTDPKYSKTYVCTLPFLSRLGVLTEHIFGLKNSVNGVHYIDERSGANQYIIDILKLYTQHADEAMRVPDVMAAEMLARSEMIGPTTPSTSAIHIRKLREVYKDFIAQDLGLPIVIDDHGVDLDAPDAFDQLVRRGLSLEKASLILEEATDRRTCINGMKEKTIVEPVDDGTVTETWVRELPDGRRAVVRKRQTYTVRFSGGFNNFINCDRFIGNEYTAPTDVVVSLQGPELSHERVSMFFPSINGYLELQRGADTRIYRLPSNIVRLPHGQPIAMLVVGQNANGYAYQLLEGTVDYKVEMSLEPKNGDMDELTERLRSI